ncbi:MAG: DUF4349 domain-containing protein [Flavobacteriales bacterium]|nr:DUF4349 domain-containing protein [Flavobacteriales bacterium]
MKYPLYTVLCSAILFACNNNSSENSYGTATDEVAVSEDQYEASAEVESNTNASGLTANFADQSSAKSTEKTSVTDDLKASPKPMLIKTGYLDLEVKDYAGYRNEVESLVNKYGGYLGNETEENQTYRISNRMTLRIPAASFSTIMKGLETNSIRIDGRRIEVEDVGEEYADLEARIKAKKAVQERYLSILQKAVKIDDILEVEEKLRVIREETEAAQGRLKYLSNQINFCTIHLYFYKTIDANYTPPAGPGFISRLWKGVVKGWEAVLNFTIGVVYLWPLWAVVAIIIFIFRKKKFSFGFRRTKE